MSDDIRCPKCGSENVECHSKPHFHECYECGFDGTEGSDYVTVTTYGGKRIQIPKAARRAAVVETETGGEA